jgi:hypothetical protein
MTPQYRRIELIRAAIVWRGCPTILTAAALANALRAAWGIDTRGAHK